jgi:hypothetical protein
MSATPGRCLRIVKTLSKSQKDRPESKMDQNRVERSCSLPDGLGPTAWEMSSPSDATRNVYLDNTLRASGLASECGEPGACLYPVLVTVYT